MALQGGGYLTCGNCAGHGSVPTSQAKATASNGGEEACTYCSGTGKVMCTACLVSFTHPAYTPLTPNKSLRTSLSGELRLAPYHLALAGMRSCCY